MCEPRPRSAQDVGMRLYMYVSGKKKGMYNGKQTGMVFKNDLFYLLLLFVSDLFQ